MSDEHQQDDRLDELLREAARDYNAPPGTPRELMWGRIEARRRGLGTGDRGPDSLAAPEPTIIPLRPRAHRQWLRWGAGIAAALALGFGLGRWESTPERAARGPGVADAPESTRIATPPPEAGTAPAAATRDVAALPPAETTSAPARPRERMEAARGSAVVARSGIDRGPSPVPGPRSPVPTAAYTVAAIQHLTQAEALLTSFRADARSGKEMDAQLSAWAKELLVSTRLMLDSPAGSDPRMRRLLEDLELVLAQIAQLGSQRAGDERNLIDEAVEGRNVLPRLRTTIPAGVRPVGS